MLFVMRRVFGWLHLALALSTAIAKKRFAHRLGHRFETIQLRSLSRASIKKQKSAENREQALLQEQRVSDRQEAYG